MFQIGDKIAHPMHGAGIIESISQEKVDGAMREYYVLKLLVNTMDVMIPVDSCKETGIRAVVTEKEAKEVFASFATIETDVVQNWNKRYRENMERLKSGDLFEVARVVKSLTDRDGVKGLSTGERKMLHFARQILVSEIVLSTDSSTEEVEKELDKALV